MLYFSWCPASQYGGKEKADSNSKRGKRPVFVARCSILVTRDIYILSYNGQADVNSYVPVLSVYAVFAGAYIMQEPAGDEIKQLSAVPVDVYPVVHALSAISIYSSSIAT